MSFVLQHEEIIEFLKRPDVDDFDGTELIVYGTLKQLSSEVSGYYIVFNGKGIAFLGLTPMGKLHDDNILVAADGIANVRFKKRRSHLHIDCDNDRW